MSPKPSILVPPLGSDAVWAAGWEPAEARLAVDQHKRGTFRWSWQLSIDCTSYPPIKCALDQRLASPCGLPWTVEGPERAPGRFESDAARRIWDDHLRRLVRSTLRDVAMMGFSVWYHPLTTDPDTLRTEIAPYVAGQRITPDGALDLSPWGVPSGGVSRWPISAVGYTAYPLLGVVGYYAIALGGQRIQLPRPGTTEGPWTVIGEGDQPHLDGAICSLDMPFTAGMLALRARSNLGVSAGRASPVGNLPAGVAINDEIGLAAQATLGGMGSEQTAALFPHGFEVGKFELTTVGAADYFHQDLLDSILMVALAIMGRGGALAKTDAQYQGPTEMDVPESLIRRDVGALERAASGLFAMLSRLNAGELKSYPKLCGHLPDADQVARRKALGDGLLQVATILKAEGDAGCAITQERANDLTALLVEDSPPAVIAAQSPARVLEWHVQQKIVAPDQALAALGLPPLPDGAGSQARLAAERLSGKDETGKAASLGDATVETTPPDVPTAAAPAIDPAGPPTPPASPADGQPDARALA